MADNTSTDLPGGDEAILVVSPDAETRTLAGSMLTRLGYRVFEACDALAASQVDDEHPGAIDFLLVEAVMSRVNGHALAQSMQSRNARLRVLFTADAAYARMARKVAAQKRLHFLVRPFTIAELAAKVRDALGDPAAGTEKVSA